MALIKCDFYSEVLNLSTSMTVILPQKTLSQIGMVNEANQDRYPTLYLLHGFSDDDTIWTRRTSIERYVAPLGLAVVMPNVHHSFYTDMEYGNQYWTFLSEELPSLARSFFPLSDKREENFVAGLSMGGYGALKWALRQPGRFAAAASLSGVMDIDALIKRKPYESISHALKLIYGNKKVKGSPDDLFWLLEQVKNTGEKPALYQCCGTEDYLYEDNLRFKEASEQSNYPVTTEFSSGDHTWDYWDQKIQNVLQWLPLSK